MSINRLTTEDNFPLAVNSLSVHGYFDYENGEKQPDRVLQLFREDANFYRAEWVNLNIGASSVYANQIDLIIRNASYSAISSDMFFDGFRYNKPPYALLRDDSKSLVINLPGTYVAFLTVASSSLFCTSEFSLVIDDLSLAGSLCCLSSSSIAYGSTEQFITASSACVFVLAGTETIKLKIEPSEITSIISDASNLTIIKLF